MTITIAIAGMWYLLIGGCTYNSPASGLDPNMPSPGHAKCEGNAQLWTSTNLVRW